MKMKDLIKENDNLQYIKKINQKLLNEIQTKTNKLIKEYDSTNISEIRFHSLTNNDLKLINDNLDHAIGTFGWFEQ